MSWVNMVTTAPFQIIGSVKKTINVPTVIELGGKTAYIRNTGVNTIYFDAVDRPVTVDSYELKSGIEFGPITGGLNVTSTSSTLKILYVDVLPG